MFEATSKTKFKVGVFTLLGLFLMGYLSVYINNHPYWWRPCELVRITVEDATGIRLKTPVKSLGMDIGYVTTVELENEGVRLQICVTAKVDMLPETKAYVRAEGFLGDKFVELKPVKVRDSKKVSQVMPWGAHSLFAKMSLMSAFYDSVFAQTKGKEIPVVEKTADVQQMVNQMNGLVDEVKQVTTSLKESINPGEIQSAVRQLNKTLKNAESILSPEGNLTATARRSLLKLEDAIDQFREQMTKVNQGQGSLGKLLNDPIYADEVKKTLESLNRFLGKANGMKIEVQMGLEQLTAWDGTRAAFAVMIWPRYNRYYHLGLASDPRGTVTQTTTLTQVGTASTTVTSTRIDRGGFALTAMIGHVFSPRVDLSLGLLHGDGALSTNINLGWSDRLDFLQWHNDLYFRTPAQIGTWSVKLDLRSQLILKPFSMFYATAGLEGLRKEYSKLNFLFGAGLKFEDEDIKLLFSFL